MVIKIGEIEIKDKEIFGVVGLVDSGKTTILRQVASTYKDEVNFVWKEPFFNFKVKTILGKNWNHQYVSELKLDVSKRISDLSYTENKKLIFLRTIFTDKRVIVLDEPFSLLAENTQEAFLKILKELNKTLIISFDNISLAEMVCNRFALIKDYKIYELKDNSEYLKNILVSLKAEHVSKASLPLKEMKILHFNKNEVEFIYKGDINDLLKSLVNIQIESLKIEEVDLENIHKYFLKG